MIPFPIKRAAQPVHWECDGGTEFDMQEGETRQSSWNRPSHCILNEDSLEFANEYRMQEKSWRNTVPSCRFRYLSLQGRMQPQEYETIDEA